MKLLSALAVTCVFGAVSAYAADPVKSDITCAELGEKYEATAEAKERFADLAGTCEGVYEVDGALYVRSSAVIRKAGYSEVTLYLPATDHTFEVSPDPSGRVLVGGRKMRVSDLDRGDEISIYLSVDKFAQERVDEIAFATEDDNPNAVVVAPVEPVEALPTTG